MIITYKTADHPAANGRQPQPGDVKYDLRFNHENGDDYIEIEIGEKGFAAFRRMLRQLSIDDEFDTDSACFI